MPQQPEDKTIPKFKQIHKIVGPKVIDWGETLSAEYEKFKRERAREVPGGKREMASVGGASAAKRAKADEAEVPSDEYMRACANERKVGKLTMPQLKAWLKEKRLPITGKKQELVDRVDGYFEDRMVVD